MSKQLCLVADVMGFSNLMRNVPTDQRSKRVEDWLWLSACPKSRGLRYQVISDTVFVTADPTEDGLSKLVSVSKRMLEQGVFRSLPLRGAIAEGEAEWIDNALWGPAVVVAHELCERSDWLGIVCDKSVSQISQEFYSESRLVVYPTPLKSGAVQMTANVVWRVEDVAFNGHFTTKEYLAAPTELLGASWHRKIEATSLFRSYLRLIDTAGAGYEAYHGNLSPHLVELFIDRYLPQHHDDWAAFVRSSQQEPRD